MSSTEETTATVVPPHHDEECEEQILSPETLAMKKAPVTALQRYIPCELRLMITKDLTDRKTMKALSLASRDWSAPSQIALFRDLTIFVKSSQSFLEFIFLLRSSPHLVQYVVSLTMKGDSDRRHPIDAWHILNLPALLPSLSALSLENLQIISSFSNDISTFYPRRVPFRLAIQSILIYEDTLALLLSGLGAHALFIHGVTIKAPLPVLEKRSQPLPDGGLSALTALRRLSMGTAKDMCPEFNKWQRRLLSLPISQLSTLALHVNLYHPWKMQEYFSFLTLRGHKLEELTLSFITFAYLHKMPEDDAVAIDLHGPDGYGGTPPFWPAVQINHACPSLQKLTLALRISDSKRKVITNNQIFHWRHTLRLLASAPTQSLTKITVLLKYMVASKPGDADAPPTKPCLEGHMKDALEKVDWAMLETVAKRFKKLQSLEFQGVFSSALASNLQEYLKSKLPVLGKSNLVNFQFLTNKSRQ